MNLRLFVSSLLLASNTAGACPAGQESRCVVPNPLGGCIQSACFPILSGPGMPRREYNRIFVSNSCNRPIRVALAVPQINGHMRQARGWWTLAPGEKSYLTDNHFRDFWLYAQSTDRQFTWQGRPCQYWPGPDRGPQLCYTAVDTGMRNYGDYTHNLRCDQSFTESLDAVTSDQEATED